VRAKGNENYQFLAENNKGKFSILIYDIENLNIRFLATDGSSLIRYNIDRTWSDYE